jgi:hypothetical protein
LLGAGLPLGKAKGPATSGNHHPEFEDAARREHASERATLVAQHEVEEQERAEMMVGGRVWCWLHVVCLPLSFLKEKRVVNNQ